MTKPRLRVGRRIFRNYRRSQSGVTAIEFAMVAPPFLALMMAIFEVGIMLFSEYIIEHGVGKAARMIRTGEIQTQASAMTKAEFKTMICGKLSAYLDCEANLYIDVDSYADFSAVTTLAPLTPEGELTAAVTGGSFDPGDPYEVVVVRAYYVWSLFTPGMTHMANMSDGRRLLAAGAAFRNEPFTGS